MFGCFASSSNLYFSLWSRCVGGRSVHAMISCYAMFSKDQGGVVGIVAGGQEAMDASEAVEMAPAEESLLCVDDSGEPFALVSRLSPASGDLSWTRAEDLSEVMRKTVSMSQMTSMLRDTVRGSVYKAAIEKSIAHFKGKHCRAPICLDIGTGTGLLSMLSVGEGAEHVVGIEMFDEMAKIAGEVVASNGMGDRITVVAGKSTEIDLGEGFAPDLLVSELLDSALLGESCLYSHGDAISRIMKTSTTASSSGSSVESRVIPHSGEVYAQLIQSRDARCMRDLSRLPLNELVGNSSSRSPSERPCRGGWSLLPLHWREFSRYGSSALSDTHVVARVDFFRSTDDPLFGSGDFVTDVTLTSSGSVDAVLLHWKVQLLSAEVDPQRATFYSTESGWRAEEGHWQDHWLQVLYPLPESLDCVAGESVRVCLSHDSIHMWLAASRAGAPKRRRGGGDLEEEEEEEGERQCSCGWHLLMNPERILQLNDEEAAACWVGALQKLGSRLAGLGRPCAALDTGDGSLLALALGRILQRAGAGELVQVISRESKQLSRLLFSQLACSNGLDGVCLWDGEDLSALLQAEGGAALPLEALLSDCYSYQMHALPTWQALSFFYQRLAAGPYLAAGATVLPSRGRVMAAALQLDDLHRSHGLAGRVDGLDHSALDARMERWHEPYYPYKLSNYRCALLSPPAVVCSLDYTLGEASCGFGAACMQRAGTCHCVALWVEYDLGAGGGALGALDGDGAFRLHARQLLKFFPAPLRVSAHSVLEMTSQLRSGDSDFTFSFSIVNND